MRVKLLDPVVHPVCSESRRFESRFGRSPFGRRKPRQAWAFKLLESCWCWSLVVGWTVSTVSYTYRIDFIGRLQVHLQIKHSSRAMRRSVQSQLMTNILLFIGKLYLGGFSYKICLALYLEEMSIVTLLNETWIKRCQCQKLEDAISFWIFWQFVWAESFCR